MIILSQSITLVGDLWQYSRPRLSHHGSCSGLLLDPRGHTQRAPVTRYHHRRQVCQRRHHYQIPAGQCEAKPCIYTMYMVNILYVICGTTLVATPCVWHSTLLFLHAIYHVHTTLLHPTPYPTLHYILLYPNPYITPYTSYTLPYTTHYTLHPTPHPTLNTNTTLHPALHPTPYPTPHPTH